MTNNGSGSRRAALFDIDGTLVDSNYLHIDAWARAFARLDLAVDSARIHRAIGMDSSKLLEALLGSDAEHYGQGAKELHARFYAEAAPLLRPFEGARELLRELKARGMTIVLATSAPEEELDKLRAALEIEDAIAAVTSADEVAVAKPEPDIVRVALEKAGVPAPDAVFIGDTVWDVQASQRAGVACIALLSGGISAGELNEAGALAVFEDAAALLDRLDESPLA